jgi:uncharacterized SAM-binding protein YcdF (DUF218 family)
MKTQKNPGRNLIAFIICTCMMINFSLDNNSIIAQANPSVSDFAGRYTEVFDKDSIFSVTYPAANTGSMENRSEKMTGRKIIQFFISLIRQPDISLESRESGPYDVIIVPGIPYNEKKITGMIMRERVMWAYYLISKGIAKNVIFSGGAVYSTYVESRIMALYAEEMGIPADHIFCETMAEHSTENLVFSYRMAEKLGFKKIAVATGPYQSALLTDYAKNHSLSVSFIPFRITYARMINPGSLPNINPSTAFENEFVSIKERESRSERFQGTLGNRLGE